MINVNNNVQINSINLIREIIYNKVETNRKRLLKQFLQHYSKIQE